MSASSSLSPRTRVAGLALAGVTALGGVAIATASAAAQSPAPGTTSPGTSSPSAPSYDDRDCPEGSDSSEQAPADAQGEA